MRPTIARSRISAPARTARGIKVTSWLCLALVEQPKLWAAVAQHRGLGKVQMCDRR
jgi:hypothetical protein